MDITNHKNEVRAKQIIVRRSIPPKQREQANRIIIDKLFVRPEWDKANTVCLYMSLPDEVATEALLQKLFTEKKTVVTPKVIGNSLTLHMIRSMSDLEVGAFSILEPKGNSSVVAPSAVDLFIIPGVAFDRQGHRLGWGKGHYDRLLEHISTPRIALAYDIQVIAEVPHSSYDVPMTNIITEKEEIICQ